jgi:hypothetical protein
MLLLLLADKLVVGIRKKLYSDDDEEDVVDDMERSNVLSWAEPSGNEPPPNFRLTTLGDAPPLASAIMLGVLLPASVCLVVWQSRRPDFDETALDIFTIGQTDLRLNEVWLDL